MFVGNDRDRNREECLHMNCYMCLVDGGGEQKAACAICQRCGAALCEKHVITHISTAPIGMGGSGNPRYLLVCQRCFQGMGGGISSMPPSLSPDQRMPRWGFWQFTRRKQPELPDPQEAIAEAERFLKKKRRQK
jgi:hypothetical protein